MESLTMALSACVKCNGSMFELMEQSPLRGAHKVQFVQCIKCGTPVGVLEYYDSGALLKKQEATIGDLKQQLTRIEKELQRTGQILAKT
jgi:transcription initiation factor IIE alpha subunit